MAGVSGPTMKPKRSVPVTVQAPATLPLGLGTPLAQPGSLDGIPAFLGIKLAAKNPCKTNEFLLPNSVRGALLIYLFL